MFAPGENLEPIALARWPRAFLVIYFAVLALLVGAAAPVLIGSAQALDRQQRVFTPAATAVDDLLTGALNQETALRGYVLTAAPSFLQPYAGGARQYDAAVRTLRHADLDPDFAHQLGLTTAAFATWQRFSGGVLADVTSGDLAAATTLATQARGKADFDLFRRRQGELATTVNRDASASRRTIRHRIDLALAALAAGLVLGLLVGAAMWTWWRARGRQQMLAERRLADNAVLLQAAIDATSEIIFAKGLDRRHILANRARVAALTGSADTDVLGHRVDDYVDPTAAAAIDRIESEVIATGTYREDEEVSHRPDGDHTLVVRRDPLHDADGRIVGVVGVARDVTAGRALLADQQRLYRLEHEMAESLQRAMLGSSTLNDDRLEVAARYRPAIDQLSVGGDWYDVVARPDGRVGLIVGDAVGHGVDSATAMGQLRSALTALATLGLSAADTMEALDRFAATIPKAHSATCLYLVVDPGAEELSYSCAGQMPPLVLLGGEPHLLDQVQDPPLALRLHRRRRTTTVAFPVGSVVVLFTDGLVERRTESLDRSLGRLAAAARAHGALAVEDLCDRLLDELDVDDHRDDVALVAARLVKAHSDHFRRGLPAAPGEVRALRHALDEWLSGLGLGAEPRADVVLAVDEAVVNAVEHAYGPNDRGWIDVVGTRRGDDIEITVRDYGRWRTAVPDGLRGRGLAIMQALAVDVAVSAGHPGTSVVLRFSPASEATP